MAFRKRNIGIQRTPQHSFASSEEAQAPVADKVAETLLGTRPSPLTGQATTSTGANSLDGLLGGHAGLALGSSVLVEESGTTDFAGALLRYYAAEGITQGHVLHIVGVGEGWVKELPGLVGAADAAAEAEAAAERKRKAADEEKMKIAWRYERLNQVDADRRGALSAPCCSCLDRFWLNAIVRTHDSDCLSSQSCPIEHLHHSLQREHHNRQVQPSAIPLISPNDSLCPQPLRSTTSPSLRPLHCPSRHSTAF